MGINDFFGLDRAIAQPSPRVGLPLQTCTWLVIPAVQTDLVFIPIDHQNIRRWFHAYIQSIPKKSFVKTTEVTLAKTGLSKLFNCF